MKPTNDKASLSTRSEEEVATATPHFVSEYGKSLDDDTRRKIASIFAGSRRAVQSLMMRKGIRGRTESRPFFSGSQDELVGLMEGLLRLTGPSSDPMSEFYLRSLANLYWLLATSRNPVAATSQKQARYVGLSAPIRQKVERFMRLNLASRIELHDMASVVNMSQSHFRRAFQISVGIPPHQFLLKLRIEAAERLLLDTDLPVATIALNCGFASQSHVTKVMQQFRGVTPGALRRSRRVRAEAAD